MPQILSSFTAFRTSDKKSV